MNIEQIKHDISEGEGLHREFKLADSKVPKNLFETVCAFLNTDGGTILLGVTDKGIIKGIDPKHVKRMKKEIADSSNNPNRINPPYLLFPKEFDIDGKKVIAVQIPLSSQLHRTSDTIFLRSEDGDYRVHGTHQLAGLLNRKLGLFTEQRVLPYVKLKDLDPQLFDRSRKLMRSYNSRHPWAELSNKELLQIGGFYGTDRDTGKKALTLASVLIFGTDSLIQEYVPAYKFDCLLRRKNVDRYDDREIVRTNLIDSYDRIMSFIEKHLNDPFYLEGDMRISLRDKIFREAVSNIISHREYTSGSPARIIIYQNSVLFENPCIQHHFGEITLENLRPFSKNPTICKFMLQLGRFDELGSGVTNISKYLPIYSKGGDPEFRETAHGFQLLLPLDPDNMILKKSKESSNIKQDDFKFEHIKKLLPFIKGEMSRREIQKLLDIKDSGHLRENYLYPALNGGYIEMTIPKKPTSRNQKYRLTDKGKDMLDNLS